MRRFFGRRAIFALVVATPLGAIADDQQIASTIISRLQTQKEQGKLADFSIDLQVDKGAVWLKGRVKQNEQEQLVLEIAQHTEGVTKVFNELSIDAAASSRRQPPAASSPDVEIQLTASHQELPPHEADQKIARSFAGRIQQEQDAGRLKDFGVDLLVEEGVLTVAGSVKSEDQKKLVLDIASRTPGVVKVINGLKIAGVSAAASAGAPGSANDEHAASEISSRARDVAAHTAPAAPAEAPTAEQIVDEITRRLELQRKLGLLKDFGIDLQVDNGVVWMSGYVADEEQQKLALDMAAHVPGVKQVINDVSLTNRTEQPAVTTDTALPITAPGAPTVLPEAILIEPPPASQPVNHEAAATENPLRDADFTTAQLIQAPLPSLASGPGQGPAPLAAGVPQAVGPQQPYVAQTAPIAAPEAYRVRMQPTVAWVPVDLRAMQAQQQMQLARQLQTPLPVAAARPVNYTTTLQEPSPVPMSGGVPGVGSAPARYDHPQLPGYAWPSYAAYPNYAAVSYPQQYSPAAWPYIGPFYPYPQVPLGWRKVTLEWDDGWWHLDFKNRH